jgi:hypothetical protein
LFIINKVLLIDNFIQFFLLYNLLLSLMIVFTAVPSAPTLLTVQDRKPTNVTLTWKPPKDGGSDKMQAYHIFVREGEGKWFGVGKVKAFDMEYKVDNLKTDKPYYFAVCAENSVGKGPLAETDTPTVLKKRTGIENFVYI